MESEREREREKKKEFQPKTLWKPFTRCSSNADWTSFDGCVNVDDKMASIDIWLGRERDWQSMVSESIDQDNKHAELVSTSDLLIVTPGDVITTDTGYLR